MTATIDWSSDDGRLRKQLLTLSKPKLIKFCKSKLVATNGNKKELIHRLIERNKPTVKKQSTNIKHNKVQSTKSFPNMSITLPNELLTFKHELSISISKTDLTPIVDIFENEELKISELKENEPTTSSKQPQQLQIKIDKMQMHDNNSSYIWILDKNRNLCSIPSPIPVSSPQKRKVSLTNCHNFLWLTTILLSAISFATKESELSMASFDRMLSLLPKNYRISIWNIINVDNDSFIVSEDYIEFVDCLLVVTGQKYDMIEDMDMEIRDMRKIFSKIVDVDAIFKDVNGKYVSNAVSKSKQALTVDGAAKIISNLRNVDENVSNISIQNDLALPILTGLTKKALIYGLRYCTQNYWKILTDVFWDEDDEHDLALCTPLSHFHNVVKSTSMTDLFGDLYCEMSFDLDQMKEDNNFLSV